MPPKTGKKISKHSSSITETDGEIKRAIERVSNRDYSPPAEPVEPAIIILTHKGENKFWIFPVAYEWIPLLNYEIEQYNIWIQQYLLTGLAPACSYAYDFGTDIILKNDPNYRDIFSYSGAGPLKNEGIFFSVVYPRNPEMSTDGINVSNIIKQYNNENLNHLSGSGVDFRLTIVDPWDGEELNFSLGYHVLPMTKYMITYASTHGIGSVMP